MKFLRTVFPLLAVLILVLAVGCRKAPESASPATPAPKAAAQPAPQGKTGGIFKRLWDDPPTLDPHLVSDTTSAFVVVELFSGLVSIDTDIKLVPDIAERWDVSADGKTYTFHLRKDAKFHNGKPVTANDFKYSIERAADPKTKSPVADTYLGDIVGVNEKLKGTATEVRGVKVISDQALQITIDAPKAYFIAKLAYHTAYVLDKDNVEGLGKKWTEKPNGTGPFKLKEYKIGERMILERNPLYYRGPAKVDEVHLLLAGGSAMAMYENGEIDITGVGLADLDRVLKPTEPLNKQLQTAPPEYSLWYMQFNTKVPPFDDVKVRQALAHAVNKELIAKQVLSSRLVPAYTILPPGFPGYNTKVAEAAPRYDEKKAKELLAQSKYAGKVPRIVLTVPGTGGSVGLDLEAIIEQWKQVLGIQVEIQQVEWATYLQDLNQNKLQLAGGSGWAADYPDPQDFLDVLFHSKSEINHTSYINPKLDSLLEQARVELDWNKRLALYDQAERLILQEVPVIPLWFGADRYALMKPYLKGYKLTPMIVPKLKEVSIEK